MAAGGEKMMKEYVIGVSGKLDETSAAAMSMNGEVLAVVKGKSCSHVTVSRLTAQRRAEEIIDRLLAAFGGDRDQCQCLLVGAAGIDSPKTKALVTECFAATHMRCPVLCLNDGNVALYATTGGVGIVAVSGKGSIVVGRNSAGRIARAGGYSITIRGDEGSAQWIALEAMHLASRWLDGSVERSPLIDRIDRYFGGLDIEKMTECARALRRQPIDTAIAWLVTEAAEEGDASAVRILEAGAEALFEVAQNCVCKLGFAPEDAFTCGVWGDVFAGSSIYLQAFGRHVRRHYPACSLAFLRQEDAMSSAAMALDYLTGKIPYLSTLQ